MPASIEVKINDQLSGTALPRLWPERITYFASVATP
jgi:hypothetical protein